MLREEFFATLKRARLLKRIGFTKKERETKLISFRGGFICGWAAKK